MIINEVVRVLKEFKKYEGMTMQRVEGARELLELASGLSTVEVIELVDRASARIEATKYRVAVRSALRFDNENLDTSSARIAAAARSLNKEPETVRKYVNEGIKHLAVFVVDELRKVHHQKRLEVEDIQSIDGTTELTIAGVGYVSGSVVSSGETSQGGSHILVFINEVENRENVWSLEASFTDELPALLYSVSLKLRHGEDEGQSQEILTVVSDGLAEEIEVSMQLPDGIKMAQLGDKSGTWPSNDLIPLVPSVEGLDLDLYSLWFAPTPEKPRVRLLNGESGQL